MGLNLPARQVVLYDLQTFDGTDFTPLSVSTVWQRAGRAGRRGLDTQGEVVLIAPSWDRSVDRYAAGQFERVQSGLADRGALAEQVLAAPMSENTVNAALRRLGYDRTMITAHGFRGMASTLLHERGWPSDVIERQLSHAERNAVKAAYNHAEHLPVRRKMMTKRSWSSTSSTAARRARPRCICS
jgi:replicative superfamily II helicase